MDTCGVQDRRNTLKQLDQEVFKIVFQGAKNDGLMLKRARFEFSSMRQNVFGR